MRQRRPLKDRQELLAIFVVVFTGGLRYHLQYWLNLEFKRKWKMAAADEDIDVLLRLDATTMYSAIIRSFWEYSVF
jgi:hypothetical protein